MLNRRLLCLLPIMSGLAFVPALDATPVADLQAPFTLAFKLTANTPPVGRYVSGGAYETSAKFVSVTVTQRDLLTSLIEDGKIAAPLAGWSLVARVRSDSALGLGHRLFAVKNGQPDFALDDEETDALSFESAFAISSFKERYYNTGSFYTGAGTIRFHAIGSFTSDGETMYLSGNVIFPYLYKEAVLNSAKVTVPVPGAIALKLTGGAMIQDDFMGKFPVVIEGSMGIGPHKITALYSADSTP